MGEIIFSICAGGFLVLSGIAMNFILRREEKKLMRQQSETDDLKQ